MKQWSPHRDQVEQLEVWEGVCWHCHPGQQRGQHGRGHHCVQCLWHRGQHPDWADHMVPSPASWQHPGLILHCHPHWRGLWAGQRLRLHQWNNAAYRPARGHFQLHNTDVSISCEIPSLTFMLNSLYIGHFRTMVTSISLIFLTKSLVFPEALTFPSTQTSRSSTGPCSMSTMRDVSTLYSLNAKSSTECMVRTPGMVLVQQGQFV